MRNVILCVVFAALASCSLNTAVTKVQDAVVADVQAVAVPDLQNAVTMAKQANPPDTYGAACWQDALNYINSLPVAPVSTTPTPIVNGIASGLEALRTAQPVILPTLPALPPQLISDCSVVVLDVNSVPFFVSLKKAAGAAIGVH